jgi:hypothetical protein
MNLLQPDDGFTQSRELLLLLCSTHQKYFESDEKLLTLSIFRHFYPLKMSRSVLSAHVSAAEIRIGLIALSHTATFIPVYLYILYTYVAVVEHSNIQGYSQVPPAFPTPAVQ